MTVIRNPRGLEVRITSGGTAVKVQSLRIDSTHYYKCYISTAQLSEEEALGKFFDRLEAGSIVTKSGYKVVQLQDCRYVFEKDGKQFQSLTAEQFSTNIKRNRRAKSKDDFLISTKADYVSVSRDCLPVGNCHYRSQSGSQYWYASNGVYRISNHWGKVGSCYWTIDGVECKDTKVGFCTWEGFTDYDHTEEPEPVQEQKTELDMTPIVNPVSDDATSLVGKYVDGCNIYTFDGHIYNGKLLRIERNTTAPFVVLTSLQNGQTVQNRCVFIRRTEQPLEIQPLRLADPEVRKSIRDRWIVSKDGKHEFRVVNIFNDAGGYKVNGYTASMLLKNFTFDDGSPIGEMS